MITCFKSWPLEFEPGSKYSYSNSNYVLLAYIIEKVSGKTYEEWLDTTIFKPLAMSDSGHDNPKAILKNRANGYRKVDNHIENISTINTFILQGSGSLYSTLQDMYKWDQALYTQKIISKQSLDLIFTPYVSTTTTSKRSHGYGWFIDEQYNRKLVEYSGCLIGFLSKYMRFINDKVSIIILTNKEDFEQFDKICNDIPAIIFGQS